MQKPSDDEETLALRRHVTIDVNKITPGGNLRSFDELRAVIERHDTLHRIKTPKNPSKVKLLDVRRSTG